MKKVWKLKKKKKLMNKNILVKIGVWKRIRAVKILQ